jgi:hypothetical protein
MIRIGDEFEGDELKILSASALIIAALFLVRLPSLGDVARAQTAAPTSVTDLESYTVYTGLANTEWPGTHGQHTTFVFEQETKTKWPCMPTGQPVDEEWRAAVDNYKTENTSVRTLVAGFKTDPPYIVLRPGDVEAAFRALPNDRSFGWTSFNKTYPDAGGGLLTASAVGFDASKTRAMVTLSRSCGSLCGSGSHFLLERVGGAWRSATVAGLRNNCTWNS